MTGAMILAHSQPPSCCCGPAQELPRGRVGKRWVQIQMRQADSDGAVAPCGCRLGPIKHTQVTPVLLLLVEEGVFESERLLRQLFMPRAPGCAREPGQGPADTGYAMGKATHAFG